MPTRYKLYIGLGVSFGVCTGIGLYVLYRRQQNERSYTRNRSVTPTLMLSSLPTDYDDQYIHRISPSEMDNDDSESIEFPNGKQIPDGSVPLSPDQASLLTDFLCACKDDEEQLHSVLTSIANASTFKESQINLANAGCINYLRDILLKTDTDKTKCKIFLALHNLALNDFAITQFSGIVTIVINKCRLSPSNSLVRLNGLSLLINMSVLDNLHEEYMNNITELGHLIESTIKHDDEALSSGKILVNLSTDKLNLESLLKITGVALKPIINIFTSKIEQSSKAQDILLRFLSFYCNVAKMILDQLKDGGDSNNNDNLWFLDPKSQRKGALYFEFFDREKQALAKSLLRPHYNLAQIDTQMKCLYKLMAEIWQYQLQDSVSSIKNDRTVLKTNENTALNFTEDNNKIIATAMS